MTSARLRTVGLVLLGLGVALSLAFFVSPHASREPDGLNKVAHDQGFAGQEQEHLLADAPTAGYEVDGVDDDGLSTGLAGVLGVTVTFGLMFGLLLLVRSGRTPTGEAETELQSEASSAPT